MTCGFSKSGTRPMARYITLATLSCLILIPSTATARDVPIKSMYGVNAEIRALFKSQKLKNTKRIRKHFASWSPNKLVHYARTNEVDPKNLTNAIHMAEIMVVGEITPHKAYLVVLGCNVSGAKSLRSYAGNILQACLKAANQQKPLLKKIPTVGQITQWQKELRAVLGTAKRTRQ